MSFIDRGFHPSIEDRQERVHSNRQDMPFRGAIFSKVVTGASDSERVTVQTTVGTRNINFSYPFASRNAWIRGQPEESTTILSIIGGDSLDLQPVSYFDAAKSASARLHREKSQEIRDFPTEPVTGQTQPYRTLAPGELDMASKFAQTFMGKGDVYQARGGLSTMTMRSVESRHETPLLTVKGPMHSSKSDGRLIDEIRFGTVRRAVPGSSNPTNQSLVSIEGQNHTRDPGNPVFAKEHSMVIDWFGVPSTLVDHRQGIVVDNAGKQVISRQTANALRAQFQWFSENAATRAEIDDDGNVSVEVSSDASTGYVMSVPAGDLNLSVGGGDTGGRFLVRSTNDMNLSSDKRFSMTASEGFSLQTKQRGEIRGQRSVSLRSKGNINLDTPTILGVNVGSPNATKYPALVAHPDYISSLNNYFAAQSTQSGSLMAYSMAASLAWSAIGPLAMLLDPSGTIMGMCLSAAEAAKQLSSSAPSVTSAVTQHLPRMSQMPAGFMSKKLASE